MSVNREQIRRDIALSSEKVDPYATIRALLAELEQAERERDDWEKVAEQRAMYAHEQAARLHETAHGWEGSDQSAALNYWRSRATDAEAQLEKVAALVEKAKQAKSQAAAPDYDEQAISESLWALVDAVLAAFEQEQKP